MKTYNGHPSYNHWNVSLWFSNDEGLYRYVKDIIRQAKNKRLAADIIFNDLKGGSTPDGAPYKISYIRHAIKDFE